MLTECLELKVSKEQQEREFVNTNAESLALAWFHRDTAKPFCIYAGSDMVGFLMLGCIESETEKSCEIWQLMIDEKHQGKGYGKAAVKAAIDYFKSHPVYEELCVAAFPENKVAVKLYESCGFTLTDEVLDDGEVVLAFES